MASPPRKIARKDVKNGGKKNNSHIYIHLSSLIFVNHPISKIEDFEKKTRRKNTYHNAIEESDWKASLKKDLRTTVFICCTFNEHPNNICT